MIKESNFIRFCQNDTPPKRNTFHRPLKPHLEKKLKESESTFLQITKTIPASFYQHKKCPLDIFTTQGFPCNLSNSIDCIQIHFQNFKVSNDCQKQGFISIPVKIKPPLTFFKGIVSFFPLHRYYPCWKFNVHGVNLYPFTMITTSIGHQNFRCYVLTKKFFLPCSSIPI